MTIYTPWFPRSSRPIKEELPARSGESRIANSLSVVIADFKLKSFNFAELHLLFNATSEIIKWPNCWKLSKF